MVTSSSRARGIKLESLGIILLRYSLVLILVYFGTFKFTMAEAQAIQPAGWGRRWLAHALGLAEPGSGLQYGTHQLLTAHPA